MDIEMCEMKEETREEESVGDNWVEEKIEVIDINHSYFCSYSLV